MSRAMILSILLLCSGCAPALVIRGSAPVPLASVQEVRQDATPKEESRLLPPEVYLRSYLQFYGDPLPLDAEAKLRGPKSDGGALFDSWTDYVGALGFPDYKLDLPRAEKSNALMVAAFERLAVALCDRAVEREVGAMAVPLPQRKVFRFSTSFSGAEDRAGFAGPFDILPRTFLGYPSRLAPPGRVDAFWKLYSGTVARHRALAPGATSKERLTPEQAGWTVVCQGLLRHPEVNLY